MSKRRGVKKNMELKKILITIIFILFSIKVNAELVKPNHKLGNIEPLFKKITTKEIEMEKSKLGK